jgi:hypothetical protein
MKQATWMAFLAPLTPTTKPSGLNHQTQLASEGITLSANEKADCVEF